MLRVRIRCLVRGVLLLRSSSGLGLKVTLLLSQRKCRIHRICAVGRTGRTFRGKSCTLIVDSVALPSNAKLSFKEVMHTNKSACLVCLATLSRRVSVMGNCSAKTSSCVAGPFSLVTLISGIGTLVEQLSGMRTRVVSSKRVAIRVGAVRICGKSRPIALDGGRFSLLLCL